MEEQVGYSSDPLEGHGIFYSDKRIHVIARG